MSLSPIIERIILILSGRVAGATTPWLLTHCQLGIRSASRAELLCTGWLIRDHKQVGASSQRNRWATRESFQEGWALWRQPYQHRFAYQAVGIGSTAIFRSAMTGEMELISSISPGRHGGWWIADEYEVINELLG